jgi:hypothetical protein
MANEVTNASFVTNGGRTAEILAGIVQEALYDPTDVRSTALFVPWVAAGSATLEALVDAAPGPGAADSSEIASGASNSAYTTAGKQITVAGYTRQYQISDLFGVTAGAGQVDASRIAMKLERSLTLTLTDLITALYGSFANTVGTSGVNLSTSDMYSAMYQLINSNVPFGPTSPVFAVLHPQQFVDFMSSLRGETGSDSLQLDTAAQLRFSGPGYKGAWKGVQIFTSDSVATANAGADRAGAMYGLGAIAYTLGDVRPLVGLHIPAEDALMVTPEMIIERRRAAVSDPLSTLVAHMFPGVVELEDLRGVGIVTDA